MVVVVVEVPVGFIVLVVGVVADGLIAGEFGLALQFSFVFRLQFLYDRPRVQPNKQFWFLLILVQVSKAALKIATGRSVATDTQAVV